MYHVTNTHNSNHRIKIVQIESAAFDKSKQNKKFVKNIFKANYSTNIVTYPPKLIPQQDICLSLPFSLDNPLIRYSRTELFSKNPLKIPQILKTAAIAVVYRK